MDIESDWKKIENKLHANKSSKKEEITIYENNRKNCKESKNKSELSNTLLKSS